MKRIPLLCLCLISLLIAIAAGFTLTRVGSSIAFSWPLSGPNTHESIMQGDVIELNNTDYSSTTPFERLDLGNVTENVTQRVIVEYGDHVVQQSMQVPAGLPAVFPTRIIVEYADTSFQIGFQRPEALSQTVPPRVIIEYADYATSLTPSPYLGPAPYTNDTSPPGIVVTREPSGHEVNDSVDVFVSANVTDLESGVKNATLQYTTDNSTNWSGANVADETMSLNLSLHPQNSLALSFNATIPKQSSGTRVRFRIIAYDFADNLRAIDGVIDTTYLVVPEFPSLIVLALFMIAALLAATTYKRKRIA